MVYDHVGIENGMYLGIGAGMFFDMLIWTRVQLTGQ